MYICRRCWKFVLLHDAFNLADSFSCIKAIIKVYRSLEDEKLLCYAAAARHLSRENDLANLSARLLLKGTNVQKKKRFEINMQ